VLAVVPFALGIAGVDVRTAGDSSASGLPVVLSAAGDSPDEQNTTLGRVDLQVASGTHSEPVDLERVTVFWVANQTYRVTAPDADRPGNGTFAIDGDTVLEDGERATLHFDLGTDDIDGADPFGGRLGVGESVTVFVVVGDRSVERELTAPDSIGEPPVSL
jgi:hypothetical protein